MSDNEKKKRKNNNWVLRSADGTVLYRGTYEDCKAEWQRRHEREQKEFHDWKAARQRNWERQGGKDDERDRF